MGSFEWMEVETLSTEIGVLESRLEAAKARHNYGLVKVVKEQIAAAQQRRARYLAHISTSLAESLDPSPPPETAESAPTRQNRGLPQKNREETAEPDRPSAEPAAAAASEGPEALAEPEPPSAELAAAAPEAPAELAEPDPPSAEFAAATPEAPAELAEPEPPSAELADAPAPEAPAELDAPDPSSAELADAAEPDPPSAEGLAPVTTTDVALPSADTIKGVTDVWDQLTPTHIERAKQDLGTRRAEMLARHAEELKALDVDQAEIDSLAQAIDAFLRKFNSPSAAASVVRLDEQRDRLQSQA